MAHAGSAVRFPKKGGGFWDATAVQIERWQLQYRRLNVPSELAKALAWLEANPRQRKTPRGMPRFLVAWLNRATPPLPPLEQAAEVFHKRWGGRCLHRADPCQFQEDCIERIARGGDA